jgi:hypothetical protein
VSDGAATVRADGRRASLIARTELRRRWRATIGDRRRLAAVAVAGLFTSLPLVGGVAAAFFLGSVLANGSLPVPIDLLRDAAAGVFVFVGGFIAIRVLQRTATPPAADLLLTAASHRAVLAGVLLAEGGATLTVGGIGALHIAGALTAGSGSLLGGLALAASLLALAALGTLAGFATGLAIRNVLARSRVLSRYRTAIGIGVFLAYLIVVITGSFASAFGPVLSVFSATPIGWFADLAFLPIASTDRLAALGTVPAFLLGSGGLWWGCTVLAARLWYIDSVGHGAHERGERAGRNVEPTGGGNRLAAREAVGRSIGVSRSTAAVARRGWLRAKRAPIRLLYATYPLFLAVSPVTEVVRTGTVPATLPPLVALYGAWASGAAFSLNPIGDEGPVLPVTLTTPVSGTRFVGGCCLAGLAIGLPVTLSLTALAGLASPLPAAGVVLVVVIGIVLPIAAVGIAAGFGALFPRRGVAKVTRGREAIVPSIAAFGCYSVALLVAASPTLLLTATPDARALLASASGLPASTLAVGSVLLTAALGLGCGAIGLRYAAREFERYSFE